MTDKHKKPGSAPAQLLRALDTAGGFMPLADWRNALGNTTLTIHSRSMAFNRLVAQGYVTATVELTNKGAKEVERLKGLTRAAKEPKRG